MSKMILHGAGLNTQITLHNSGANIPAPIFNIANASSINIASLSANGGNVLPVITPIALEIELQNGHQLDVYNLDCQAPVTFNITLGNLCLNSVAPNTTFNVIHNNNNYTFNNPVGSALGNGGVICFGNMNKFLTICETVNSLFPNGAMPNIDAAFPLDQICFLRDYQSLNHELVTAFMHQNSMVSTATIDMFINENFFELEAIAHSLEGSLLDGEGPYNVLDEIKQYICSQVTLGSCLNNENTPLAGQDGQDNDGAGNGDTA